jgi:OOP family OmpA-OmpF porin
MFRINKRSEMTHVRTNKLVSLLQTSALGLFPALLAFNVIANDELEISTSADAISAVAPAPVGLKPVIMTQTGTQYVPVGKVSDNLSQVVFYRPADAGAGASHVYVDREFQSALKSGEFTVFCVAPGNHNIEAYGNDAPNYDGKDAPRSVAKLLGGKTYFIETNPINRVGIPVKATRVEAEKQLFGFRNNSAINRAAAVRACEYVDGAALGNVLFKFAGNTQTDIEDGGIDVVQNLASHINGLEKVKRVNIVGHADPVGDSAFNQRLSLQRADAIKKILIADGVPASLLFTSGEGDSNPTVDCTELNKAERNFCNRANRRVDVLIQKN